ncbi:MAG: ABC transporter substrate-binding protein [Chloroflexi bacterium]|nr:ABC transporter substrate-binding protein [Chloroflexota bacterium]
MNRQRWLIALTVGMVLALVAVACAPAPAPTSAPPPATPATAAPVATTAPSATKAAPATGPTAATAAPTQGGVLRISIVPDATIIGYPVTMVKLYDFEFALTSLETLIRFDKTGAPIPNLAKTWKVDPAAKTISLTLQQGVKFQDGTDFNAKVAKWNLDSIRNSTRTELKPVSSIDVVDDYTLRLNLSTFDNSILTNLGGPAGLMISEAAFEKNGAAWAEKNPVGTGPFQLVSWQRDVKQVYKKFDGYWRKGEPYLDGVEWDIVADPMVRLASFQRGEADVTVDVEPSAAKQMETEGKYRIGSLVSGLYGLTGDSANASSVFANIKVRQAVEYAIDKQAICDTLGYGYWTPLYQPAVPGGWAENPNLVGYKYDPAKAKQLLAEAGYPNGFKTTIYTMNSPQIIVDMLTAVQGYLKAVGIDAQIDAMDHGRFGPIFSGTGWKDGLTMIPMGLSPDEIGMLNRLYLPGGVLIPSAARPPAVQQKLAEIGAAADFAAKQKLTWELQKLMIDDNAMAIWLRTDTGLYAMQKNVHDDGFAVVPGTPWTPETAWMSKQ